MEYVCVSHLLLNVLNEFWKVCSSYFLSKKRTGSLIVEWYWKYSRRHFTVNILQCSLLPVRRRCSMWTKMLFRMKMLMIVNHHSHYQRWRFWRHNIIGSIFCYHFPCILPPIWRQCSTWTKRLFQWSHCRLCIIIVIIGNGFSIAILCYVILNLWDRAKTLIHNGSNAIT